MLGIMYDYQTHGPESHEVFDIYTGLTVAYCASEALALRLIELHEGI